MKTTITKVSITLTLAVFAFGVFGYATSTDLLINEAQAVVGDSGGCGSCGGGGSTGGDGGGGGTTVTPPACDVSTNISSVVAGASYTITWNVGSASSVNVYINGAHVNKTGSATYTFRDVNNTETFRLTAQNAGGSCNDTVVVTKTVVNTPSPTCDIRTNLSVVSAGEAYTISWNGTPSTGTTFRVNGVVVAPTDSATYSFRAVNNTEKYTMTGTNSGGTCTDEVTVTKKAPEIRTCDVRASATSIATGGSITLTWATQGFSDIKINGVAVTGANGTKTYTNIQANTTYTLTAKTADGTGNCTATVTVICVPPVVLPPSCVITANPYTITAGGSSNLSWTSQNAVSASLNQSIGSVAVNGTRSVSPSNTTTYTMTVTNSAGVTATCARAITVTPVVVPAPTCALYGNPHTIDAGNSARLTWTSQNAVTGIINQGVGEVNPTNTAGYRDVSPSNTTTYTMTVTNSAGVTATCAKTITVVPRPEAPVCNSFTANPATITRGGNSTLSWNTTNVTAVTINNGVGAVAVYGSTSVSPIDTVTYTLTATGANNQQVSCPVTVTVSNPPEDTKPVCESFTASPNSLPNGGGNTTLTWNTSRATNVSISPNIGAVATDGQRLVSVTNSTTYTLTARDADNDSDTCTAQVTVAPVNPPVITCSANVNFTASPTSIREGQSTNLAWNTNGITSVRFDNGISTTGLSGSVSVNPTSDRTYTLTASNGTDTINCPISINVDEDNGGGGGGGTPTPRCELKISDRTINRGDRVTLTWETSNATEVELEDNHGKTLITTDGKKSSDKKDLYDGEITLRPDRDTTYTLLAERGSKDKTCTVKVAVKDSVVVLETRDQQPLVAGIALTQVPYTGFEAGPFMTVMFYTLLALWALYLAYIFVIRPKMGMVPATAAVVSDNVFTPHMFAAPTTSVPNFHPEVVATPAIAALSTAVVGYESHVSDEVTMIENRAHAAHILLSGEAIAHLTVIGNTNNLDEILTSVFVKAKASYPSEEGWVVINLERLAALLS